MQVVNRLVANAFSKRVHRLFQQVVTSPQIPSCNKSDFNRLVATDEIDNFVATWPVKLTICNMSVAFFGHVQSQ